MLLKNSHNIQKRFSAAKSDLLIVIVFDGKFDNVGRWNWSKFLAYALQLQFLP